MKLFVGKTIHAARTKSVTALMVLVVRYKSRGGSRRGTRLKYTVV